MLKMLSQLSQMNIISSHQKEYIKNVIINHNSPFLSKLEYLYNSNIQNKDESLRNEIIRFAKSLDQKYENRLSNKQMRVITEETEELEDDQSSYLQSNF